MKAELDKKDAPKCIYCGSEENEFNREHVIPQAFGTFEPESFVLYDAVCKSCNQYFGDTLEISVARDSFEALLRLHYGLKQPAEGATELRYGRIELKVDQPGPWFGATVVLMPDKSGTGLEAVPVPQIAFRWKGSSDWHYVLEKELSDDSAVRAYRRPTPGTLEIRVMGGEERDRERLVEKLKAVDIRFAAEGTLSAPVVRDGSLQVEVVAQVDTIVLRTIAKIAFNYVAYHQGADFVLKADFDEVRRYVRYGTLPSLGPVVRVSDEPILFDDGPRFRQTNGHLITFDWNSRGSGLIAQVSLFNRSKFQVTMCRSYSGIWHDGLRTGHHFDLKSRKIEKLGAVRGSLLF